VWQELRSELHPRGLEVVTVALDVDPDAARPFVDAAHAEHPSLLDQGHLLDERFGVVNVPNGVSIDISTLPPDAAEMLAEARKIQTDPEGYKAMLVDWVEHGAASRYALAPEEVVRRSQPRGDDEARAAAHFELGQHLHRMGDHGAAIPHWREAHRLYPSNWTYKRQAWEFEDPMRQGHTDAYESSWFEDVKKIGAENYYPTIEP